jgi:hypothetical protein
MWGAKRRPNMACKWWIVYTVYTCRNHRTLKSMMLSCYDLRHVDMADNALPRQYLTIMWGCGAHAPVPTQRLDDVLATWSHLFPRLPCRTRLFLYTTHAKRDIFSVAKHWVRTHQAPSHHVSHYVTHQSDNFNLFYIFF